MSRLVRAGVAAVLLAVQPAYAGECLEEFSKGTDYFPADVKSSLTPRKDLSSIQAVVQTANLFEIAYGSYFKVILEHMSKEQYVLVQCGAPIPTEAEINAVQGLPNQYTRKSFTIPLGEVATESTVQLSFLENLGLMDRVRFVSKYAVGACWQKAKECNGGYEGAYGQAAGLAAQNEQVNATFTDCSSASCTANKAEAKYIHFSASQDPSPLAGAEHAKFLAMFFNKESEAKAMFDRTLQEYNALVKTPATNAPRVAWIEKSGWGTVAFKISMAGYKTRFVTDIGGANVDAAAISSNLGAKVTTSDIVPGNSLAGKKMELAISGYATEQEASDAFFAALSNVDVVIDETYDSKPKDYTFATFLTKFKLQQTSTLPFIANKKVFRLDGTISSNNDLDWFESRLAHPQWMLQDLDRAIHGTGSTFRFLRNIAVGESPQVISKDDCKTLLPACSETDKPQDIKPLYDTTLVSGTSRGARFAIAAALAAILVTLSA